MTPSSLRETAPEHVRAPVGLRWDIWRAWVLANLVAEVFGLGLVGVLFLSGLESRIGVVPAAVLVVICGAVWEGGIVGSLQWMVLRRALPALQWRAWAIATAIGAGVAWALGMVPSVVMSFVPDQSSAGAGQGFDMAGSVMLLLAAAMGIALGSILSAAQWPVLRKHVPRAGWWIPANAGAWAAGMTLIFAGVGFIPDTGIMTPVVIATLIACLVLAGAMVGVIHGFALIWLLRERDRAGFVSHAA